MPLYDNTRLRITPWPGTQFELPDSSTRPYPVEGWAFGAKGGIWAPDNMYGSSGPYPRLGESYLELAALDLENEAEMRSFITRWGPLGVRWFQDPVSGNQIEDKRYSRILGIGRSDEPTGPYADELRELRQSLIVASTEVRDNIEIIETLAEFRFGAALIRDVLKAWRWQQDDVPPLNEWEFFHKLSAPESADQAAEMADDWTHGLLSAFYPQFVRIELNSRGHVRQYAPHFAMVPLLSLMALELYNHACEEAEYKTCSNETCGRLFVRQSGRALHGQHRRTGVKYCSSECARAQAQRSYRRRRASYRSVEQGPQASSG